MSTRRDTGPYYCSKEALARLEGELATLETQGRDAVRQLFAAAQEEGGNLDENGAYQMAMRDQELLDRRVADLQDLISRAVVQRRSTARVTAGVTVTLSLRVPGKRAREQRFMVDSGLATPAEDVDVVSPSSPLGRELLGTTIGDELSWRAPAGMFTASVLAIGNRTTPVAPAKKAPTKKAPAKKATSATKAPTRKAPAKKAPAKKAPAKKAPTKKAPAKKAASVTKAPTKKAPTKKAPTKKAPTKKAPTKKAATPKRTAAQHTPARKASSAPKKPTTAAEAKAASRRRRGRAG